MVCRRRRGGRVIRRRGSVCVSWDVRIDVVIVRRGWSHVLYKLLAL